MSAPHLDLLLGRRILGAILKKGQHPGSQLFLILDDGTYAEVYSEGHLNVSTGWSGGVEEARAYMRDSHHITDEAHMEARR